MDPTEATTTPACAALSIQQQQPQQQQRSWSSSKCSLQKSTEKLLDVASSLQPWLQDENPVDSDDASLPRYHQRLVRRPVVPGEEIRYRCRCQFQMIVSPPSDPSSNNNKPMVCYAVRRNHTPVILSETDDEFQVANPRIQRVMPQLLHCLNEDGAADRCSSGDSNGFRFRNLRCHLTSVSFASSWSDSASVERERNELDNRHRHVNRNDCFSGGDCVVTLHYDAPLLDESAWKQEAKWVAQALQLAQLTGRSKKRLMRAWEANDDDGVVLLRDTLWIVVPPPPTSSSQCIFVSSTNTLTSFPNTSRKKEGWQVRLKPPQRENDAKNNQDSTGNVISVHYEKPQDAFCHPNATVMCQALEWILNQLSAILAMASYSSSSPSATSSHARRRVNLLELYCGMGAHTVALASAFRQRNKLYRDNNENSQDEHPLTLDSIVALELDQRLVRALRRNCQLNHLPWYSADQDSTSLIDQDNGLTIQIVCDDAGKYSKKKKNQPSLHGVQASDLDILLVDPPRQGLDPHVCQLALHGSYDHLLYISCGRAALVRDLGLLSEAFEIVDCTLLDLFPGTTSVESLVHLQRRTSA